MGGRSPEEEPGRRGWSARVGAGGSDVAFGLSDRPRQGGDWDLVFVEIVLVYLSCSTVSDLASVPNKSGLVWAIRCLDTLLHPPQGWWGLKRDCGGGRQAGMETAMHTASWEMFSRGKWTPGPSEQGRGRDLNHLITEGLMEGPPDWAWWQI